MSRQTWRLVLSAAAEADLANIAAWTAETFGARQAEVYADALLDCVDELTANPFLERSRARDEIAPGLRSLHMSKSGRRGRHFILYRAEDGALTIVRILHESMEMERHLP